MAEFGEQSIPLIGRNFLEKHIKYKTHYPKNSIFYGMGIENEVYLEFEQQKKLSRGEFMKNTKRERHSVDYTSTYNGNTLAIAQKKMAEDIFSDADDYYIPYLMNAYGFIYCDKDMNERTTYSFNPKPNPLFNGQSLKELLFDQDDWLRDSYDVSYTFDGDTVEFITQNFANPKLSDVMAELYDIRRTFVDRLNCIFEKNDILRQYGHIDVMSKNHQFATYMTNPTNYGMFNNGTLHINITLPTFIGSDGLITDVEKFTNDHKRFIKLVQYLEPIFVAAYGSGDGYAKYSDVFANGSQRCSVSRYIGLGTFDTDIMRTGRILTEKIHNLNAGKTPSWWYHVFHSKSAYMKLEEVGLDINFNKHYNHGVEIRFFDHVSYDVLETIMIILSRLADFSLNCRNHNTIDQLVPVCKNNVWNETCEKAVRYGNEIRMETLWNEMYTYIFGIDFSNCISPTDVFAVLLNGIEKGEFSILVS